MKNKLKWWRYKVHRFWHDGLPAKVANLLPRKVVYWCAIRLGAYATTGKYGNTVVTELDLMEAIKRYADDHKIEE